MGKEGKSKSRAIPVHAWRGFVGSRGLRLSDFETIGTRIW